MNQTTNSDYNEMNILPTKSVAGQLPTEILRMILYQLVGFDPSTNPNFFDNVPHQLCRVNRHWNQAFTPFLYAHYRLNGEANRIKGLWCLLRTLYTNPEIAKYVRYLVLTEQRPSVDDPNSKETETSQRDRKGHVRIYEIRNETVWKLSTSHAEFETVGCEPQLHL